ncbi:MAG: hypothetical protein AAFZ01_08540 [Pseudomonadota bacterium]
MKAFIGALILLVGITVVAKLILDTVDMSAATINTTSQGNVRL